MVGLLGTQYPQPPRTPDAFSAPQNTPLGYPNTLADYWDNYLAREAAFRKPVGSYTSYALAPQERPPADGMSGAIAANQDVYRPRYAGSDDFGGGDDGFGDPYGGGGDPYGGDGGFIGDMFGLFGAPSGEGTAIQNAGAGARGWGKALSVLGFVPGPIGWASTGLSAIAGLTELDAINSALANMHEEWGLTGPPPSISMLDALTKAAFNPFVDLQDLVAPKALDMEAEHDVNEAVAAAAATSPADESFGQGFDPGEFGGPGGYGGIGQAETAPGSTPGWGSQEEAESWGYGGDFGGAGGGPGGGDGGLGPGAGTDSESYGGGEY